MSKVGIVQNFENFSWELDRPSGERVAYQRLALVLREIYEEVYLVIYPKGRVGEYHRLPNNYFLCSHDKLPKLDALFFVEDYSDWSGTRECFVEAARTDNVFLYHFAFGEGSAPGGVFKAIILWAPEYRTAPSNIPVEYHPMYIPRVSYPTSKWRVCFTARGQVYSMDSRVHLLLDAYIHSKAANTPLFLLRGDVLLNDQHLSNTKHLEYLQTVRQLAGQVKNLSIVLNVSQNYYRRILSETKVIADITTNHLTPAVQEALCYGAQVIRSPRLNHGWIQDEDVLTIPKTVTDEDAIKNWLVEIFNGDLYINPEITKKYQRIHGLENSVQAMKQILQRYGAKPC